MNDVELYEGVVGIELPWRVADVKLELEEGRVDIHVQHGRKERFACPECRTMCAVYDHSPERTWRHLDTCQYQTLLHASPPRVKCSEHGVRQAVLPWAEKKSQFTMLFERFAIDVLRATDVAHASRILRISRDEAWTIQDRAVRRGQARRAQEGTSPTRVGVDEKSPPRGKPYFTIVSNLDTKTVRWIGHGHGSATLNEYWDLQSKEALEVIAIDMGKACFSSAIHKVPNAVRKIVFDRYHVMGIPTKAVDQVRRDENTRITRQGETSPLAKTRYMWLYSEENLPEKYEASFAALKESDLLTAKAWRMKELLRKLWLFKYKAAAGRLLSSFIRSAKAMGMAPIRKLGEMLSHHRVNILTYIDHRVTSASCEGINSTIQAIKPRGRGYRNRNNFKAAIYFALGGLYPRLPTPP